MRAWRRKHPLNAVQRAKDAARAYASQYLRRGKLQRQPCGCGCVEVEMHHDDYTQPLAVRWLCRVCHVRQHTMETPERAAAREATAVRAARAMAARKAARTRRKRAQAPASTSFAAT